jgi:hypothetical protein
VGIKENDGGVNSSMIYLIYCKTLVNIPSTSTVIKKEKKKNECQCLRISSVSRVSLFHFIINDL